MPKQTKKGGSLELAPLAATSILVAAQKLYKDMMAGERKKSGGAKTLRGGEMTVDEAMKLLLSKQSPEDVDKLVEAATAMRTASEVATEKPAEPEQPAQVVEEQLEQTVEEQPEQPEQTAVEQPEQTAVEQPEQPLAPAPEEPAAQIGGKRKTKKSKRHGGAEMDTLMPTDPAAMIGGAKKKRHGGNPMPMEPMTVGAPIAGGAKKAKRHGGNPVPMEPMTVGAPIAGGAKKSKRGGGGPDMLIPAPNSIPEIAGGAKKTKRRGGSAAIEMMMPATTTPVVPEIAGGAKKKSRGGEFAAYMSQLNKLNDSLRKLM